MKVDAADLDTAALDHIIDAAPADGALPGVVAGVTTAEDTIYLKAAGPRAVGGDEALATDAVLALFSMSKPLTATLALQLVDDALLDLDAPAAEYAPDLSEIGVLTGFDGDTPVMRAPRTPVTIRQLLTHTAGFAYDFFDADCARAVAGLGLPDVATATQASLQAPLMFDPGTRWEYGTNLDWAGRVIEGATGRRLGDVMTERLLTPLGMRDTTFRRGPQMLERTANLHVRTADGHLKALRSPTSPDEPELDMGGQGLYSTAGDFLRFIRFWLRGGRSDSGQQLLRPETVDDATRNHLGALQITPLPGVNPRKTNDVDFFPGVDKGWNLVAMTNISQAPTGRTAGSMGWAGLANLYFWVDARRGIGGLWATQLLPFFDPAAVAASQQFEQSVYDSLL